MNKTSESAGSQMKDYFRTRGYVPGGIITNTKSENVDFEIIPPFLRTLLVTDGTVTKSLEAFFWEKIVVENLGQSVIELDQDVEWLEMSKGDHALQREVRLKGAESGNVYVYAKSLLKLELLPSDVRDELLAGRIGIGEVLRERGMETYREILDIGRKIDEELKSAFETPSCGELLYRTYRVVIEHKPAMMITEVFPYRLYAR